MREGFNVENRVCGAIWRPLFANISNHVADNKISIKPGPRVTKELRVVYSLQETNFSATYPESAAEKEAESILVQKHPCGEINI